MIPWWLICSRVFKLFNLLPPANEVSGKVIFFLHLCVILFTGRRWGSAQPPIGRPPQCKPPLVGQTPPDADPLGLGKSPLPSRYGQQAGGTHPTGMHTYSLNEGVQKIWGNVQRQFYDNLGGQSANLFISDVI